MAVEQLQEGAESPLVAGQEIVVAVVVATVPREAVVGDHPLHQEVQQIDQEG